MYDLEERTLLFAREVRSFVAKLRRTLSNIEDGKQLVRSSRSVRANYIEANGAFSKKDFLHRIKISKKEAKESRHWLSLVEVETDELRQVCDNLAQEATELMKIFGAILEKSK